MIIMRFFKLLIITFVAIIIIFLTAPSNNIESKVRNRNNILKKINIALKDPHVKAFLDTISYAEGTFYNDSYNFLYGGYIFKNFSDHPRTLISNKPYNIYNDNNNLRSTAAGRYQILEKTWDNISNVLNLNDFGPLNQDRAAVYLIDEVKALEDIINNNFEIAVKKVSKIWSCFPDSPYGQPKVELVKLKEFYYNQLKKYKKLINL